jgi:hypothetical protein
MGYNRIWSDNIYNYKFDFDVNNTYDYLLRIYTELAAHSCEQNFKFNVPYVVTSADLNDFISYFKNLEWLGYRSEFNIATNQQFH